MSTHVGVIVLTVTDANVKVEASPAIAVAVDVKLYALLDPSAAEFKFATGELAVVGFAAHTVVLTVLVALVIDAKVLAAAPTAKPIAPGLLEVPIAIAPYTI